MLLWRSSAIIYFFTSCVQYKRTYNVGYFFIKQRDNGSMNEFRVLLQAYRYQTKSSIAIGIFDKLDTNISAYKAET